MASTLYAAVPTLDDSSPLSRTRQGFLNRYHSLAETTGSWTNPFLSRFPSLSTGIGSLTRSSTATTSAVPASSIPASELVHGSLREYETSRKGQEEEEEIIGLVAPASNLSKDPFDDSNAVKATPKPLWHRGITAAAILAGLIALGLGLGLGIKKITRGIEENEAARMSSSLASLSTSSTSQSSSSTVSSISSPSSLSSSSSDPHSTSVLSPSITPSPTTTPIGNDIFWAVAKTA
ncbi:hypothetical protein JCM5353_007605 [Sporobolomyces roseus]